VLFREQNRFSAERAPERRQGGRDLASRLRRQVGAIREYRNIVVHEGLASVGISRAVDQAYLARLWFCEPPYFLRGLVAEILAVRGQEGAADRYEQLVEAILADIDAFSFRE